MPVISSFYGITVKMYYNDHPPPHFHAEYGENEVVIQISPVKLLLGSAPKRVCSMIFEWSGLHQEELNDNWGRARRGEVLLPIDPLE